MIRLLCKMGHTIILGDSGSSAEEWATPTGPPASVPEAVSYARLGPLTVYKINQKDSRRSRDQHTDYHERWFNREW